MTTRQPVRTPAVPAPRTPDPLDVDDSDGPAPAARALAEADFHRLGDLVYRKTGIRFTSNKRYFVDKRVHAMMARSEARDFSAYFARLRVDADELQHLVNELTVNETYFYREDYQLDSLIRNVLPQVMANRRSLGLTREPVRILSLPCSTGEEPYSIGIKLLDEWPDIEHVDVSVVGGDIDTRVLNAARRGVYGTRSVQRLPRQLLERWFEPVDGEHHQIVPLLREAVGFTRINLSDQAAMRAHRDYDVIFCRNLLIYFDELSSRLAAANLFEALRPGGFLFLGHSESMSRISPIFTPRRFPEGIVYQRPALQENA